MEIEHLAQRISDYDRRNQERLQQIERRLTALESGPPPATGNPPAPTLSAEQLQRADLKQKLAESKARNAELEALVESHQQVVEEGMAREKNLRLELDDAQVRLLELLDEVEGLRQRLPAEDRVT